MELSSREIAVLVWAAVAFSWAISKAEIRTSLVELLWSSFHRAILTFIFLIALWTIVEVSVLRAVGLWTPFHLKDTLLWFALTALVTGLDAVTGYDNPDYAKTVLDGLRIVVIVEFIAAATTFPLLVELLLVPTLATAAAVFGYVQAQGEHRDVERFLAGFLGLAGLAVLSAAGFRAWADYTALANLDSFRTLVLPPALSLLFLPIVFALVLQARYEWLFLKVRGDWRYRTYARLRLLLMLGPRPQHVLEFGRKYAFDLPVVRDKLGFESMLRSPTWTERQASADDPPSETS